MSRNRERVFIMILIMISHHNRDRDTIVIMSSSLFLSLINLFFINNEAINEHNFFILLIIYSLLLHFNVISVNEKHRRIFNAFSSLVTF